jgi:predicted PurR-regulated permease PerM
MPFKVGNHGKIPWVIFLFSLGIGCVLWVFSPILAPFLLGAIWAYLYHPIIKALVRWKVSRLWAAFAMTLLTYVFIVVLVSSLFPFIRDISSSLTLRAFHSRKVVWEAIEPFINKFFKGEAHQIQEKIDGILIFGAQSASSVAIYLLQNGWALAQFVCSLLLSPIIGFYIMKDWPTMRIRLLTLVPIPYRSRLLAWTHEINISLSQYFRGQLAVCIFMGIYYSVGLSVLSLPGGVTLGVLTGMLLFIPYIGFLICMVSACLTGLTQTGELNQLVLILCLYGAGQLLESMILTPLLIGKKTGLHPVWILFFIFAGGMLKGIVGVFLALPVATVLGACWRLFRRLYVESSFYNSGWVQSLSSLKKGAPLE